MKISKKVKDALEIVGASAVLFAILTACVLIPSGYFQSDEDYIASHPEIYREDGNWREDWAKYLKNPEVYMGQCYSEE